MCSVCFCSLLPRLTLLLSFFGHPARLFFFLFFLFWTSCTRHRYKYRASLRDHLIYIKRSHVAHINASCRTCKRVMSHKATSHVTHMKESCDTYRGASRRVNESCRTVDMEKARGAIRKYRIPPKYRLAVALKEQFDPSLGAAVVRQRAYNMFCSMDRDARGSIDQGELLRGLQVCACVCVCVCCLVCGSATTCSVPWTVTLVGR